MTEISRIETLYAFVMVDPKTNVEGVVSFFDEKTRTHIPMVGARPDIMRQWEPLVVEMVERNSIKISLIAFEHRRTTDEFIPTGVYRG